MNDSKTWRTRFRNALPGRTPQKAQLLPIEIPHEIRAGFDALWHWAGFPGHRYDVKYVTRWLRHNRFDRAALWIEVHEEEYLHALFAGYRVP